MKKFIKIFSILGILALFAGCDDVTSRRTTNSTSSKNTTGKVTTKDSGDTEFHYLTLSIDTSADTASLKNTIKVMNTTTGAELENGSGFKEDDQITITVFNCASDVKFRVVRLTDPEYELYPSFGFDQLTGSAVTTGQEPVEINAPAANMKIELTVDDGSEDYEYGKIYFHNTASNITFEATRLDEDGFTDITLNNGDTVIVDETVWIDVDNSNGTEAIMVTEYTDNQYLETEIIAVGNKTRVYFNAATLTDVYFEPYTTCTFSAATLPIGTSLTVYNQETESMISFDNSADKYTTFKVFVNNENSSSKKIFEIIADSKVLYTELINANTSDWYFGYILTDNVTLKLSEIEGPTIEHPGLSTDDGYWVSAYYIYGPNEEDTESLDSGDKIPTGYHFGFTIYLLTDDPSETINITISMGGEVIKTATIPYVESGGYTLVDDAFIATDNIVVTVS